MPLKTSKSMGGAGSSTKESKGKHLFLLVLSLLLWGVSFPVMKYALDTNSPFTILFYRFLFSFIILVPIFMFRFKKNFRILRRNKKFFLLGLLNFMGIMLQIMGINYTTSTKSVIITQILVLVVPLPAYFILKEKLDARKAFGISFSLLGAVILSTNLNFTGLLKKGTVVGDLLTFSAVIFFALLIVYTRKYAPSFDAFILHFPAMVSAFILSFFPVLITGGFAVDGTGIYASLFLAVFCTIIPSLMYNYSLKKVDAITSSILGPIEILSGALLAFIFLDEFLTKVEIIGGILIIISIYIVTMKKKLRSAKGSQILSVESLKKTRRKKT